MTTPIHHTLSLRERLHNPELYRRFMAYRRRRQARRGRFIIALLLAIALGALTAARYYHVAENPASPVSASPTR